MFDEISLSPTADIDELKKLIERARMLSPAEKRYWMDLLETMSKSQLQQLKNILVTEEQKFQDIDQQYDQKLSAVSQKFFQRWDSEKAKTARLQRHEEESSHEQEAAIEAAKLLHQY